MTDQLIRATGLWAKTSGKTGKRYLTGRLGGLRVLVLENRDRKSEDEPSHLLMLGEAEQKPRQDQRSESSRPAGVVCFPPVRLWPWQQAAFLDLGASLIARTS
jgi:hypothetical protein